MNSQLFLISFELFAMCFFDRKNNRFFDPFCQPIKNSLGFTILVISRKWEIVS
jgi:hypothetical protein